MRSARRCVLVAAIVAVAGCAHDCTKIGCIAGVDIAVTKEFAVDVLPVSVTTCADDVCNTGRIDKSMTAPDRTTFGVGGSVVLEEKRERDVAVTFEVRSVSTGEVLVKASGTARLVRSQPNGDGCEPVCYGANLTYPGTGDLLEDQ